MVKKICGLEKSISGHAKCGYCYQKIKLGTLRVGTPWRKRTQWHHSTCSHQRAMEDAKRGHMHFALDKTSSRYLQYFKEEIKVYNKVRWSYPLKKAISTMTGKELREELKKREMQTSGNKSVMQSRLRNFLQTPECLRYQSKQNEKAVFGFTRKFQKEYKYNVPIPLQHMIRQFYPTMTH